jgi:putative transposase
VRYRAKAKLLQLRGVVSLDPGVRTFQTCYDADGNVTEWGKEMNRSFKECFRAGKLQAKMKGLKKMKKRRMRKVWLRKLARIRNRVDEVRKKLSTWLCRNHRVVLIPKFEVQRMVEPGS